MAPAQSPSSMAVWLVEAFAGFVHGAEEGVEFSAREATAHADAKAALAEEIDHDGALGDTQRVVPGEDDGGGAEVDVGARRGEVGHQLQVVGAEGVVVEVVLDRP
jgi:hypothetical protein